MTAELPPFTPSFDWVRDGLGDTSARVYGAVFRFCQMREGVCRAGLDEIARRAGVCRRTAKTHLDLLVDLKCIADQTPNLRNHPHRYTVAGCKRFTVQELHSARAALLQCKSCTPTVQQLPTDSATVALEDTYNQETREETAPPSPAAIDDFPSDETLAALLRDTEELEKRRRDAETVKRFKADFPPGTVGDGRGMRKGDRTPYQEDLENPLVAAVFDALDGLDDVPGGLITHTDDERRVCSEKIVRRFRAVTPEQITWGVRLWGVTNWREGATTLYSKGVPAEIAKSIAAIVAATGRGEDPEQVVQAAQERARGKAGPAEIPLADQMRMV